MDKWRGSLYRVSGKYHETTLPRQGLTKSWVLRIVGRKELDSRAAQPREYVKNGLLGHEPVVESEADLNPAIAVWLGSGELEDVSHA